MSKRLTSRALNELLAGRLVGSESVEVTSVAALEDAEQDDVSFLGDARYREKVASSRAGIILVPEDFSEKPRLGQAFILCKDPSQGFTELLEIFAPPQIEFPAGIHPAAVVADSARIAASAHIGACAVVEANAKIADNSIVTAGCYIGVETEIGSDCLLHPNVTVRERCRLGNRVIIHSGTVIGSDGFGYLPSENGHQKIPQRGNVVIEDEVEIGAQVAVDRARFGTTLIKRGAKIDNLVQIAHNVVIGEHCFIIAQVGISGSTRLGRQVIVAGQAGLAGHLNIGDGAVIMAQSGLSKDLPAGTKVFGSPAVERKEYARQMLAFRKIDKLQKQIKELQKIVADLRKA